MLVYVYVYVSVHNYQKNDNMIIFHYELMCKVWWSFTYVSKKHVFKCYFIHLFKQENALRTNCTHNDM